MLQSYFKKLIRLIYIEISLALFKLYRILKLKPYPEKINLCSGSTYFPGYYNLDITLSANLTIDIARHNLPFPDNSIDTVVCMSAINYFTYKRGSEIIKECYRVLKPGAITRFGVQDLELLAKRYVNKNFDFFFQKKNDGTERFEGRTLGDKFVAWFYGYQSVGGPGRYFYDYESLACLFQDAGFTIIERMKYQDSRLSNIELIDNRPNQMFFLEAIK